MTTDSTTPMEEDPGRVVKVCKGEEVRRFQFKGTSFSQLKNEIASVYQLPVNTEYILQYQDEEDDRITLSTDMELMEAMKINKGIIRFFLVDKSNPATSNISPSAPPFFPSWLPPHHHQPGAYVPPHLRHPPGFHPHHPHPHPHPHPPPHSHPPPPPPHMQSPFYPPHQHYGHHRGSVDEQGRPQFSKNWTKKPHAGKRYAPFDKEERKRNKEEKGKEQEEFGDEDKRQWKTAKKEIKQKWKQTKTAAPLSWPENKKLMIQELKELKAEYKTKSAITHGQLVARHVKDVTVPDGSRITPNTPFIKTWRIRNEGAPWPVGCCLLFISRNGDKMGGPDRVELSVDGPVETNQEVDVSISLISPASPGRYVGFWRMCSPEGKKFGQRVWVSIIVPSSTDSPVPASSSSCYSSSEDEDDDGEDKRYENAVNMIASMGFDVKKKRVRKMLKKSDGDVEKVVNMLTNRMKTLSTSDPKITR